ncbi:restriction endonuclease subunit S [Sphingomonas adhaesiva]|uniref:restriction endonuclease subunit S n=1 Tax=Sphingomonas adhaesiva TaxID=28212 RepID=UPI0008308222|nr:restriction endonuclease subunit S [Sphingomonas adhaesiva]
MSFPAYPSYQDSGIDWLGEVPADWRVQKFRFTFRESGEKIESEVVGPMLSVSGYRGIEIKEYDDENQRRTEEDLIGYRIVRPGQLVVNTMWLNYAGLGVSAHEGHVSPAYRAYSFLDQNVDSRFVHYLLRCSIYVQGYTQLLTGIRPNSLQMTRADLMDFPVLLPPASVQTAIAAFLDRETTKIDALIEEQRRLIALLKEKRQAVISHAVTKGLDPNAPMKDSGIEWLGDVPAHWTMRPIKAVVTRVEQGWSPQCDSEPVERSEQWGVLKVGCVNGGVFNPSENKALPPELEPRPEFALRAGDVLISRANTRELVGSAAVVERDYDRLLLCDKLYRLSVNSAHTTPGYLVNYLQSDVARGQIEVAASGASSSMLNIGQSVIRAMPIPTPPLTEQLQIVAHLQRDRSMSDALIHEAQSAIALLVERRAALISAAVTGKIDVRGSAKVLPFPIDRARARGLIATEIIERSAHQSTFGRVKFQKIAFLAEGHVGISQLAGCYTRAAAGPLDGGLIEDMERGAHSIAGIERDQPGGSGTTNSYILTRSRGSHRQELADWLGPDRTAKLDKLITDFAPLNTKQAEAVATLYSVWNDLLSEGAAPSDDEIISGFLNDWHPEKRTKFRASELPEWLGWMRRHGIVPTGSGPKTTTGRLLV